jgi:hypothetical protein
MGLRSSQSVSGTKQTSAVVSMSQLLTYSYAAGITPAMAAKTVNTGSQYTWCSAVTDSRFAIWSLDSGCFEVQSGRFLTRNGTATANH